MASASIEYKGLRDLGARMRELGVEIGTKVAHSAVSAGAKVIKEQAVQNIRTSPSVETGKLRDNVIQKRVEPDAGLTSEYIVTVRRKVVPYAKFLEFGTVKMPAEAFLRPAFDEKKVEASDAIVNRLHTAIAAAKK